MSLLILKHCKRCLRNDYECYRTSDLLELMVMETWLHDFIYKKMVGKEEASHVAASIRFYLKF